MSGTYRSAVHSSASGKIKTENPDLVKLLTSDSLTDTTRFVASEHNSQALKHHASTNSDSVDQIDNKVNNYANSTSDSDKKRPNSKYSEKVNTENRPSSIYSEKGPQDKINTSDLRHSVNNNQESEVRTNSRVSLTHDKPKENSNNSSWGNVDESLTFDVENPTLDQETKNTIADNLNTDRETIEVGKGDFTNSKQEISDSVTPKDTIAYSPSKIDHLQVDRVESPLFQRAHSKEENKPPSRTSQNYSYNRLKNSSASASQQHPFKVARSASQLIDAQSGEGFEGDSLDVDSGLVPDTTSLLESAPGSGRQTHRVTTPVSQNVPVIKSADSSRFRANSRTSHRSFSANSATGVIQPQQLDRSESLVSDNGIPPPSNINYDLPNNSVEDVNEDSFSPNRKLDQRKSAVSFKEPVISDYHSHIGEQDDWDTPIERVPPPRPSTPPNFQDSLDFENQGRTSNLSPEPTHQLESDIPSAAFQTTESADFNNSSLGGSARPVKKIYIDSPTFTREEEEEFRFVESRLDEMNDDLEDTVRRIEEQGDRYRQEREAMNEEAARLRAEIQAAEGYSNSYNTSDRYSQRDNYTDNYSKPVTHPSDEMEPRNYGRQNGYQNGYSENSQSYTNLRDSRDVYNGRIDNRYEDRNDDPNLNDSRVQGGYSQNEYSQRQNNPPPVRQGDQYGQRQNGQYGQRQDDSRRQEDLYSRRQDDQYGQRPDDSYSRRQDDQYAPRHDDSYSRRQNDQYGQPQEESYSRRQDGQYYDRRGGSPSRIEMPDERGDEDLQRETEYQEDLRHRVESGMKHDSEVVIPRIPLEDEQFRDSLDENGYNNQRNFVRDSLEPEGYGNWGNPPPNPFGQGNAENAEYLSRREERPDFVDENDTARMELLHPQDKHDYVEENKFTYGLPQNKSYKTLKIKEKEAEQKLQDIFIHPKKPPKKHKRTIPLPNEERRPPLSELAQNGDGAEGVWAKRSAQLAKQKDGKQKTGSGSIKKSRGLQKYPSDSGIHQTQSQGQIRPGPGQGRMYGTPTRNQYLEPLGYKPQVSTDEPRQSPSYRDASPKKPVELAPIKTEITTDDGQKISVDINLKVLSPTFQRRVKSHPNDAPESEPPFNVHAEVLPKHGDRRPVGVQYQPTYRVGSDKRTSDTQSQTQSNRPSQQNSQQSGRQNQDGRHDSRQDQPPAPQPQQKYDVQPMSSDRSRNNPYEGLDDEQIRRQEEALMAELNLSPNPYAKIPPIPIRDELTVPVMTEKGGYAAMYEESKNKDDGKEPWYQVYTLSDFKRMQKEVRLGRGTLGPDLDNETYKEKLEKRHKQFQYARMVMEKNKIDLKDSKKSHFPRKDPETEEAEKSKRKAQFNRTVRALDYAKNVPKPQVKPRPNQYNSYEVASQLSPIVKQGSTGSKSPTHSHQSVDVVDLKKLQQRHEQEKKNVALIRQNLETVPQKA